jgi:RNA-directed DNA polymerase
MIEDAEPTDKLDAPAVGSPEPAQAEGLHAAVVNGPKGGVTDWVAVDWSRVDDDVRRLGQRIFTASNADDLKLSIFPMAWGWNGLKTSID